jgi:ribokinase
VLYEKGGETAVDGFAASVVDTTGAGDAFAAGQIAGFLAGLGPEACGRLANALGAAAVSRRGAGLAMPGPGDIEAYLGPVSPSGQSAL